MRTGSLEAEFGFQVSIHVFIWVECRRISRKEKELNLLLVGFNPALYETRVVDPSVVANDEQLTSVAAEIKDETVQKPDEVIGIDSPALQEKEALSLVVDGRDHDGGAIVRSGVVNQYGGLSSRSVAPYPIRVLLYGRFVLPQDQSVFSLCSSLNLRICLLKPFTDSDGILLQRLLFRTLRRHIPTLHVGADRTNGDFLAELSANEVAHGLARPDRPRKLQLRRVGINNPRHQLRFLLSGEASHLVAGFGLGATAMSCDCSLFSVLFEGTQHFPDPLARHAKGFGNLGALYTFLIGLDNALAEGFLG